MSSCKLCRKYCSFGMRLYCKYFQDGYCSNMERELSGGDFHG
jgi:hypothetical protein